MMASQLKLLLFLVFQGAYHRLAPTAMRMVPGMLSLSNLFFRLLWPKGNVIEVQGSRMYIDVHDPNPALRKTFQAYGMARVHEEETTTLFESLVKPGAVVLDLGANIGYFTLLAARLTGPSGKVIAFEPEPRNFQYLTKNIELNGYQHVDAFEKAVSDRNGKTTLFICDYDSGHHTINQYGGIEAYRRGRKSSAHAIEIEVVALDEFLRDRVPRVDVIKMDLEGAEALAVEGMHAVLTRNDDIKLVVEFFPLLMTCMGSSPKAYIDRLLHEFGFTIYAIGHEYDLGAAQKGLLPVRDYEELARRLQGESDHANLLLSREH